MASGAGSEIGNRTAHHVAAGVPLAVEGGVSPPGKSRADLQFAGVWGPSGAEAAGQDARLYGRPEAPLRSAWFFWMGHRRFRCC